MNILPKKRWHVRTRENIARVRKDEQEAAEEANEKKQRILQADREARTALLRQRARNKFGIKEEVKEESSTSQDNVNRHVNFFEELEEKEVVTTKRNEETEKEEKEKREDYEKKLGYLTYLGQDTVETTGNIPWYDKTPDHLKFEGTSSQKETDMKSKTSQDPLTFIRKHIPTETKGKGKETSDSKHISTDYRSKEKIKKHKKKSKKHKKRKSSSSSSDSECDGKPTKQMKKSLEQLRVERMRREKQEQERTEELLAKLEGKLVEKKEEPPLVQQKYNSQYNPELAKQNFAKERRGR